MKRAISLVLFLATVPAHACRLAGPTVSLSAPITGILREMGLLKDPHLRAISTFHPIATSEYAGSRLGGGMFLSRKGMVPYREAVLFFDESGELARRLRAVPLKGRVQVRTRGPDPFALSESALDALGRQLENCASEVSQLKRWLAAEKAFQVGIRPFRHRLFFLLGRIQGPRLPDLLMVADGPPGFWAKHGKLRTMPGPLAYVRWGEKWRASLAKDDKLVGLVDVPAGSPFRAVPVGPGVFNVEDPDALFPGPGQVRFMRRFVEKAGF